MYSYCYITGMLCLHWQVLKLNLYRFTTARVIQHMAGDYYGNISALTELSACSSCYTVMAAVMFWYMTFNHTQKKQTLQSLMSAHSSCFCFLKGKDYYSHASRVFFCWLNGFFSLCLSFLTDNSVCMCGLLKSPPKLLESGLFLFINVIYKNHHESRL